MSNPLKRIHCMLRGHTCLYKEFVARQPSKVTLTIDADTGRQSVTTSAAQCARTYTKCGRCHKVTYTRFHHELEPVK